MSRGPIDESVFHGPDDHGPTGGVPDHLIDSILDGDLPREKIRRALEALRRDQHTADDLAWTADALDALRADASAPDLSDIILARTGMHRSWLSAVMQRRVLIGRITGVAAVLTMVAGAFVMQRMSPETFDHGPSPIAGLVRAVPSDAARAADAVRTPATERMSIAIFAADEGRAYVLDDKTPIWTDGVPTLAALRQWWTPREQSPEPGPRMLNAGYTAGIGGIRAGGEFAVLTPTASDHDDRESAAAIVIDRR